MSAFVQIESWWDDLTTNADDKKPQKKKPAPAPDAPTYSEFSFSNICDAISDVPQRGEKSLKLRYWMFRFLIQYIQRDPNHRRDNKAFKVPNTVRGAKHRLMNLSAYMPFEEENWIENMKQLFWEIEFMQSPAADDIDSDDDQNAATVDNQEDEGEEDESDEEQMETDDAEKEEQALIKANRDPEVALISRRLQRRGSGALSTPEERVNALSILVDYCCKTSQFKKVLNSLKQEDKSSIASINVVLGELRTKKADYTKKITAERAVLKEMKVKEIIANMPPPPPEVPGAPAPPPRPFPKIAFTDEESETLMSIIKERDTVLRQLEERRDDLITRREDRLRKSCPQPVGMDRFMNLFWIFKGDEFGHLLFVESPLPWPELFQERDLPENGDSSLSTKPIWTQKTNWFLVRTEEELDAIIQNLSKLEEKEAALIENLERFRARLTRSDHFCGSRFKKVNVELSYFDAAFREKHSEEPPAKEEAAAEESLEKIRKYYEDMARQSFKSLKDKLVRFHKELKEDFVRVEAEWDDVGSALKNADNTQSLARAARELMDSIKSDTFVKSFPPKKRVARLLLNRACRRPSFETLSSAIGIMFANVRQTINPLLSEAERNTGKPTQTKPEPTKVVPSRSSTRGLASSRTASRGGGGAVVVSDSESEGDDDKDDESDASSSEEGSEEEPSSGDDFEGEKRKAPARSNAKSKPAKRVGAAKRVGGRRGRVSSSSEESEQSSAESEKSSESEEEEQEKPRKKAPAKRVASAKRVGPAKSAAPRLRKIVESSSSSDENNDSGVKLFDESDEDEPPRRAAKPPARAVAARQTTSRRAAAKKAESQLKVSTANKKRVVNDDDDEDEEASAAEPSSESEDSAESFDSEEPIQEDSEGSESEESDAPRRRQPSRAPARPSRPTRSTRATKK